MAHCCSLCSTPLVERTTLVLKTINLICADCLGNVKQLKGLKKPLKKLALSVEPTEAHIVMCLGGFHTPEGFMCFEDDKGKFVKWLPQTATLKGGISVAETSTPFLVKRK